MNAVQILVNLSIRFARLLENLFNLLFVELEFSTIPIKLPLLGSHASFSIDLNFTPIELILGIGLPFMIGVLIVRMLNPIT